MELVFAQKSAVTIMHGRKEILKLKMVEDCIKDCYVVSFFYPLFVWVFIILNGGEGGTNN